MSSHDSHLKSYIAVYVALLLLVVATVGAAMIPLGSLSFPVMIGIAFTKAFLIMWIFMHVKNESSLVKIFAFLGIGWMSILFVFLMADYLTRADTRADYPGAWQNQGIIHPHVDGDHGHADHPVGKAAGHSH